MSPSSLNKRPQITGLFSPRSPLEFIGFAIINALIGLLSSGNPIGFITVPLLAIAWWLIDRQRLKQQRQNAAFSLVKEPPQAAKGLILLLSPYSPQNKTLKDSPALKTLITQVNAIPTPQQSDFDQIELLHSNLVPQIKAVEYHVGKGKLRDVWLIATESSQTAASSPVRLGTSPISSC